MHMIAIANHCQKWLLTKMCMVNSFFEILCITSNTTPDSLVQLMWPMSLLLFKIKFKSQMLRFFLNLHGLLVKHCVNLCPHQQSYLIIFSMTWQLSQSLTWEARRRKKKWRERTRDVGMSVYRTGSASGAMGCRDLVVWPLLRALWMSSSIFIDLLWLMSPATSKIKLQRSHTSQEGRKRAGKSEAENERCRGSERSW